VGGFQYEYLIGDIDTCEFPPLPSELVPPPRPGISRNVRDAARYVMMIDSIQGKEGSRDLVRACAILRDAGFTEAQAMIVLLKWNASGKAQPPWSPDELARACSNTYLKKGA